MGGSAGGSASRLRPGHWAVSAIPAQGSSNLNLLSGASLPTRVLSHLYSDGPSYARAIAEALDHPARPVREAAVSQALASLKRRQLVISARAGHRVYYSCDVEAMTSAVLSLQATVDEVARTAEPPRPPAPMHASRDLLDVLDEELRLLKLEQHVACGGVDPEIVALMWDSEHGQPARHRQLA